MSIDSLSIAERTLRIEDALAKSLNRADFEVVAEAGERYLRPILQGHVMDDAVLSYPMLSLDVVAREIESLLS